MAAASPVFPGILVGGAGEHHLPVRDRARRSSVRRTPRGRSRWRRLSSSNTATVRSPGFSFSIGTTSLWKLPTSGSGRRRPRVPAAPSVRCTKSTIGQDQPHRRCVFGRRVFRDRKYLGGIPRSRSSPVQSQPRIAPTRGRSQSSVPYARQHRRYRRRPRHECSDFHSSPPCFVVNIATLHHHSGTKLNRT